MTDLKPLDHAFELLHRIDVQCRAVGHPVGEIDELKAIYRAALTTDHTEDVRPVIRDAANHATKKYYKMRKSETTEALREAREALEDIYARGYEMSQHEMVRAAITTINKILGEK